MTTEENQAQALEREIARLLDIANERTRVDAKIEERRAARQAEALVQKQAKEHVQAMLKNPDLKRQAQLQPSQVTQQPEQPKQLTNRFEEQIAEINKLLASIPGGKPITKMNKVTTSDEVTKPKLSNDEQYRIDILTKMKARISQQTRK
ncbi:hypothetical protein [Pseudomonas sp. LB3P31]